ncbi:MULTISPECIES: hypothetical protein [Acinetobacter]|uniref:hypothetical protein n=1 Tax=Acinetobacter TaxID=469 RepID=UPI0011B041CA|nr:hypothetical protein [Acinetobacter sp. MYb10]QLD60328.1 hypothetical protein CQZ96_003230 [Acinetobacter sp. MYb10]
MFWVAVVGLSGIGFYNLAIEFRSKKVAIDKVMVIAVLIIPILVLGFIRYNDKQADRMFEIYRDKMGCEIDNSYQDEDVITYICDNGELIDIKTFKSENNL